MQKTLDFLEQNVQWFALALGGIFVIYCAYAYVYNPPATVKLPGQKESVVAGGVEDATSGLVRDYKRQMIDNFPPIVVADVVKPWRDSIGTPPVVSNLPNYAFISSQPGNEQFILDPGGDNLTTVVVSALPELPKAQVQTPQSGLSVVATPAAAAAHAAQPVATEDLLWVTVPFVIPAKDIKDAFEKPLAGKKLDPQLYQSDVLQVDLQRQRATGVDASGQPVFPPGDEGVETVPPSRIQKTDLQAMPSADAAPSDKDTFADWASRNVPLVTQPKFYDVKAGDPWQAPQPPGAAPNAPGVNPAMPAIAPLQPFVKNPVGAPGGAQAGAAAHIDPLTMDKDILVWAHDETAKPGQTYRYRLVYHMKNPVLNEKGIGDPKLIGILDLKSPPSDWSAPVKVKETTEFFLTAVRPKGDLTMDIFHWEKGNWTKASRTLWPGDQVPQTDWSVIDVHNGSGYGSSREKYVLLTDEAGDVTHHYTSDRTTDRFKELTQLVAAPAPPAGAPAPVNPGRPNPAGRPPGPSNDNTHGKPLAGPGR